MSLPLLCNGNAKIVKTYEIAKSPPCFRLSCPKNVDWLGSSRMTISKELKDL